MCIPIDGSPPGSPVPGILQARTLERVAISFSSAWKWKVKVKSLSRVRLLATPWTTAYQAPRSMGFSRREYWSGVPLPSPGCRCLWARVNKGWVNAGFCLGIHVALGEPIPSQGQSLRHGSHLWGPSKPLVKRTDSEMSTKARAQPPEWLMTLLGHLG